MNRFVALKGRAVSAQGNALGLCSRPIRSPVGAIEPLSCIDLSAPLQGCGLLSHLFPGLRPGLTQRAPLGLKMIFSQPLRRTTHLRPGHPTAPWKNHIPGNAPRTVRRRNDLKTPRTYVPKFNSFPSRSLETRIMSQSLDVRNSFKTPNSVIHGGTGVPPVL